MRTGNHHKGRLLNEIPYGHSNDEKSHAEDEVVPNVVLELEISIDFFEHVDRQQINQESNEDSADDGNHVDNGGVKYGDESGYDEYDGVDGVEQCAAG